MKRACNFMDQNNITKWALTGIGPEEIGKKLNIDPVVVARFMPVQTDQGDVLNAREVYENGLTDAEVVPVNCDEELVDEDADTDDEED